MIIEKLAKQLYDQGVIGYCTVEFIVSLAPADSSKSQSDADPPQTLFWAIDLKYGLTDFMVNFNFCSFTQNASKMILKSGLTSNLSLSKESEFIAQNYYFSIPYVIEPNICQLKMSEIIKIFRTETLVFDSNKSSGILWSIPDLLQCGIFGLSGIGNTHKECIKLLDDSISLIKSNVKSKI